MAAGRALPATTGRGGRANECRRPGNTRGPWHLTATKRRMELAPERRAQSLLLLRLHLPQLLLRAALDRLFPDRISRACPFLDSRQLAPAFRIGAVDGRLLRGSNDRYRRDR